MNRPAQSAVTTARNMLRDASESVRENRDALRRLDRNIASQMSGLRRWHHSEYQVVDGVQYVGDFTDETGTISLTAEAWRTMVDQAARDIEEWRSPLVGKLQAASARQSYWRAECDRLTNRKAS